MLKRLFGLNPQLENDGSYKPSKFALMVGTSNKTDYKKIEYKKYNGSRNKILVLFTEEKNLKMRNGKHFSTGNHPVEALVPMLHLQEAGFDFEIVTPSGKPVVFEMWAFPKKDTYVNEIYKTYLDKFENPLSLKSFISGKKKTETFAGVFIPGGHGSMIGIPENENVSELLHWAHQNELYTISLCHGPGAFLSTTLNNKEFLFKGYKLAVFPDSVDEFTPKVGYLPGLMPFPVSEKLRSLGAEIVNEKSDKTVVADRHLITGASPLASNELGKLAAKTLLENIQ